MTGGYVPCACRDCFEIAIGPPGKAMCHECVTAGCELAGPWQSQSECQAPHAYGGHCDDPKCCEAGE